MQKAVIGRYAPPAPAPTFKPKLIDVLRGPYRWPDFQADMLAGLTVAIVALPLSMALAIASGASPDKGLLTAVVAGFLISALGGSSHQVGGPTGAFVVVVFNVIATHGYDGLVLATLMAGIMLVIAGAAKLGTFIKYMPEPVITGFTTGIAVIIFTSQIRDLFGLQLAAVPAAFADKLTAFWEARETASVTATAVAFFALAVIIVLRRYVPRSPQFLIAVTLASVAAAAFALPVETIGSRFGGISASLPMPGLPNITLARIYELMPAAFTIAFLAGVESLLSAVIADGMTGEKHRSNTELIGQGIANVVSALFAGLPATGALARTAANIRCGARSPVAGMLCAVFVLLFIVLGAKFVAFIPLASLAAVLVIVAWNMSEVHRFRYLLRGGWGDRVVLVLTFVLTVAFDLTVAIQVGVVLAAILFMHRMSEVVAITEQGRTLLDDEPSSAPGENGRLASQRQALPPGTEVFHLRGPLFFGAASRLGDLLERSGGAPKTFILRMEDVPLIDTTGAAKLAEFAERTHKAGTGLILSGLKAQPRLVLRRMRLFQDAPHIRLAGTYEKAIIVAANSARNAG